MPTVEQNGGYVTDPTPENAGRDGSYESFFESAGGRAMTTYEPVAPPRRCPICGDPSDYHCGDLGCMGSWPVSECGCTLGAAQVERMSADV